MPYSLSLTINLHMFPVTQPYLGKYPFLLQFWPMHIISIHKSYIKSAKLKIWTLSDHKKQYKILTN